MTDRVVPKLPPHVQAEILALLAGPSLDPLTPAQIVAMVRAQEAISHYVRETDDLTRKIVLQRWCKLLGAIPGFAVVGAFEQWPDPEMPTPRQIADDATRIAAEARRNNNRQLRVVADNAQPRPEHKPASLADQIRICREELAKAPDSAILNNMLTRLEARQCAEQAQREDGAA